jgi:protein-S-isoprenylcysteine O-methyltransferase Ste14
VKTRIFHLQYAPGRAKIYGDFNWLYRMRHPLYAAFVPFFLGTTLLLGSWYGILFGLTLVGLIAIRALLEERMLRKDLKGYDATWHR